jgi:hypothetical protein
LVNNVTDVSFHFIANGLLNNWPPVIIQTFNKNQAPGSGMPGKSPKPFQAGGWFFKVVLFSKGVTRYFVPGMKQGKRA